MTQLRPFLEQNCPNKKYKNKMSSNMGSVPDPKRCIFIYGHNNYRKLLLGIGPKAAAPLTVITASGAAA